MSQCKSVVTPVCQQWKHETLDLLKQLVMFKCLSESPCHIMLISYCLKQSFFALTYVKYSWNFLAVFGINDSYLVPDRYNLQIV